MDLNFMLINSVLVTPLRKYLKKVKPEIDIKEILFTKEKMLINKEIVDINFSDIPEFNDFEDFYVFINTVTKEYEVKATKKTGEFIELKNVN